MTTLKGMVKATILKIIMAKVTSLTTLYLVWLMAKAVFEN